MPKTKEPVKYVLGLHLAAREVSAALVGSDGKLAEHEGAPLVLRGEYEALSQGAARALDLCGELAQDLLAAKLAPSAEIVACGVAAPGVVDVASGTLLGGPTAGPGFAGVNLRSVLEPSLQLPVWAEREGNCAAYAEARFGAGRGLDPVCYVAPGEAILAGLVAGGEPFHGADGSAAALGHTVIDFHGKPCRCGARGCWETEFSTGVIREAVEEAARDFPESVFGRYVREGQMLTYRHLFAAVAEGDAVAQRLLERFTDALAAGCAVAFTVFAPQILVLGGEIAGADESLLEAARQKVSQFACTLPGGERRIVPAALIDTAALIGAAALALRRI